MKNLKTFFFCIFPVTPKQGLSLIEVLVVLVIISILIAIGGVGLMANLPEYRLKSAAREIVSSMQKTRIEAVKRNASCRLVFDVNNNRYAISTDSGVDDVFSTIDNNTNLKIVQLSSYKSGICYGSGSAAFDATKEKKSFPNDFISYNYNILTFNSRGTCGPGSGFVYIQNQKNDTFAIGTLSSGGIKLYRWDGSEWSE